METKVFRNFDLYKLEVIKTQIRKDYGGKTVLFGVLVAEVMSFWILTNQDS